jgi:hypothetical protein
MPARLSALPLAAAVFLAAVSTQGPSREIDNVAAFARLYGVVRYFYPSDAAAELDWDRLAVHGVTRVRPARDSAELAAALRALSEPLGPGIVIGASLPPAPSASPAGGPLVAWRYLGPGFAAGGPYRAKRTHREPPAASTEGFATVMQTLPAQPWRGKAVRLRGQIRASAKGDAGGAALWLRVDRPNHAMGFFDNMGNRIVRDPGWRSYSIEGTVADDAEFVAFGVMTLGTVTADFDDVELSVADAPGAWTTVPIADPGFEAAAGSKAGWFPAGTRMADTQRPTDGAPQGAQYLRFAPPQAGQADSELFAGAEAKPGAHAELDLGAGVKARVPLTLTDAEARVDASRRPDLDALAAASASGASANPDVDQRLADTVVAWNVLRHFYPYWTEAGVDWDGRLRPNLEAARDARTRAAQADALRRLVADARDGHGHVVDTLDKAERGTLPLGFGVVEGRIFVVASDAPGAPVGAELVAIDGVPAAERLAREMALASGSTQWRRTRAGWSLASGPKGAVVKLRLDDGSGPREVALTCGAAPAPPVKRPAALDELKPGLWYVDLTRAKMAEVTPRIADLAAARGVVFDLRGYPTDAGGYVLPYLLDAPETDRWMHVARIVGPFYAIAGWDDMGWDVKPASPRISGKVVFLTDGGAISYAESVMGYVADRKLGTIVGSTTAGTNGNVATFTTPGGFRVGFTGMRVTRHDGRSAHHLVGVQPDVVALPTIAGLRAGRDEVLERGVALVQRTAGP